ncbi:ribosome silencing factor [Thermomicrobium sp. 4228-Ro]|uniref:ribosome silencing factor n=1 Tax=Thermomicrobium sp. 4228-Ro TaxID=2993937 RepID=UPI00224884AF|nr:ribosome silencing factor [Thermomicrobium sp. 4228-Ro]MCX2725939.1 ribosome silencing factor [Thermomicrobium sp. 4228-Ro]
MTRVEQEVRLTPHEIARVAAESAADALASDIQVLDLTALTPFFDLFVVCTADNTRQLRALVSHITNALDDVGVNVHAVEGEAESGWVILDYGSVMIHLFTPEQRAYYRLEDHWAAAQRVLVIQ